MGIREYLGDWMNVIDENELISIMQNLRGLYATKKICPEQCDIFKAFKLCPYYCITFDQTLESWARQGILMINSALTVEMNKVGSHTMMWRPFISKLLRNISENNLAGVYVLFGKQAQTFKPYINSKSNFIIEVEHPAYFARNGTKMPHQLFADVSNKVKEIYGVPIDWYQEY